MKYFSELATILAIFFVGCNNSTAPAHETIAVELEVTSNTDFIALASLLVKQKLVVDSSAFVKTAQLMGFDMERAAPGKYKVPQGLKNAELVKFFRETKPALGTVVLNGQWRTEEIVSLFARGCGADSVALLTLLKDNARLQPHGFNKNDVLAAFMPNTYYLRYRLTPEEIFKRMVHESRIFWTEERKAKAKSLGLNTKEIYTLASIVERETTLKEEKSKIAGVYHNRLKIKGWKLEAAPTVCFAINDFSKGVLTPEQRKFDSPYNTYLYPGLPPGPIGMPTMATIDAVLNAEKTPYMYFCANPNKIGHAFAKTLAEHKANVEAYKRANP